MSSTVVSVAGFSGGLNLRDAVDAVDPTQAIDAMNVEFTLKGAVRQRPGYDNFTTSALSQRPTNIEPYYNAAGNIAQIVTGSSTRLDTVGSDGAVVASATSLTSGQPWSFARFASPANDYIYAGNGENSLRRWDGSSWATVSASPQAALLEATQEGKLGGRLAAAAVKSATTFAGQTATPSHVFFSDGADPTSWTNGNYVQLAPGDGEKITAMAAWQDGLYVFKESKFFKFYGVTDVGGVARFDYYPINTGVGCVGPRAIAAGSDGLYFADRKGVYRTRGQAPELVSDAIGPIFDSLLPTSTYYEGGVQAQAYASNVAMAFHNERLYVSFTSASSENDRTLVFDPRLNAWAIWSVGARALVPFRPTSSGKLELYFAAASGANDLHKFSTAYETDNGATISSHWRSGWTDFGANVQKRVRAQKLWGTGLIYVGLSVDYDDDSGQQTQVDFRNPAVTYWGSTNWGLGTWSTPRGLVSALRRRAARGTTFSLYLANTTDSTPWSVHKLEHRILKTRRFSPLEPN